MGPGPLVGGLNPPGTAIQPTILSGEKFAGTDAAAWTGGATPAERIPNDIVLAIIRLRLLRFDTKLDIGASPLGKEDNTLLAEFDGCDVASALALCRGSMPSVST